MTIPADNNRVAGRTPGPNGAATDRKPRDPDDPLKRLLGELGALSSFTGHFAQAKLDLARAGVRRAVFRMAATLVGAALLMAGSVVAVVYLMRGAALGLTAACGGRTWLGYLLTGTLYLALLSSAAGLVIFRRRAARREKMVQKYDRRKAKQRARHGRDVEQAKRPGV